MVGLLHVADPAHAPRQHAAGAARLAGAFGGGFSMAVLALRAPGGHQGDLLVVGPGGAAGTGEELAARGQADDAGCRLLTFDELLAQHEGQQHQQAAAAHGE
ncbi:hypothetical protein HT031_006466 [Scenedesmus sp. PABB004]|nr:hypothetical protein HT031_006466 [Scenedesmus sp. PABB004]